VETTAHSSYKVIVSPRHFAQELHTFTLLLGVMFLMRTYVSGFKIFLKKSSFM